MDFFGPGFASIFPQHILSAFLLAVLHIPWAPSLPLSYQVAPIHTQTQTHTHFSAGLFLLTVQSLVLRGCYLISQRQSCGPWCFSLSLGLFTGNHPPSTYTHIQSNLPTPGLSWECAGLTSLSALLHEFITNPNNVQTQLQTFTQHLNQSSFASSSVSFFTTFPPIWGREQGALKGEALFCSFFLLANSWIFAIQRLVLWNMSEVRVLLGPEVLWNQPQAVQKQSPNSGIYRHSLQMAHEWTLWKYSSPSNNTKMHLMNKQLAHLRSLSSKDVATKAIRVSSYEMKKSGHGPSVKCLNKLGAAKTCFYCSEWSEIGGWAPPFTTQ